MEHRGERYNILNVLCARKEKQRRGTLVESRSSEIKEELKEER
jgi:hypothetical protein